MVIPSVIVVVFLLRKGSLESIVVRVGGGKVSRTTSQDVTSVWQTWGYWVGPSRCPPFCSRSLLGLGLMAFNIGRPTGTLQYSLPFYPELPLGLWFWRPNTDSLVPYSNCVARRVSGSGKWVWPEDKGPGQARPAVRLVPWNSCPFHCWPLLCHDCVKLQCDVWVPKRAFQMLGIEL